MKLLAQITTHTVNYGGMKVMLPLSGGINSAAALCWLGNEVPSHKWPAELHLYYSHFKEHSPGTLSFVLDLIRYAKRVFPVVKWKVTRNSVNEYFREQKMIPHPTLSPCSRELKVKPAREYFEEKELDIEIIGYVDTDLIKRGKNKTSRFDRLSKQPQTRFPILEWSRQNCIDYVQSVIGWYPAIYDLVDEKGKPEFSHNNCLPCKNMHPKQLGKVAKYYPEYAVIAQETADAIPGAYWGREDIGIFACDVCERLS